MTNKLSDLVTRLAYIPQTLRLIWTAARGWTLAWLTLLVLQGLLPATMVYLTRLLVDSLVLVIGAGATWPNLRPVLILGLLLAGLALLSQLLQSLLGWVRAAQAEFVQDYLSGLVHARATSVDLAFYESPEYYDRLNRAREDASRRPLSLLESMGGLLQSSITLLAMGAMLLPYGLWLPLVLLLSTLPGFYVLLRFNRRYHRWWEQTTPDRRWTQYYDLVQTHLMAAAEIRLFNLGPHFHASYQAVRRRLRSENLALLKAENLARLAAESLGLLVTGLAMAWMVWQALQGLATLGDLTLFYQVFSKGQRLLGSLLGNISQLHTNTLFLQNLFDFLAQEPGLVDPLDPLPTPPQLETGIRFDQITFRYPGSEQPVFEGFSLNIPAGRNVAIVGTNGAGKSTLLKLLCRFYDPQAGQVELDGLDLRRLSLREVRRRITVLFQDPMHYHATVAHNISLGDLAARPAAAEIEAAATAAGAHAFIERLPAGYQTRLGKAFTDGTELSGGEWQRLALARAFFRQAPIVILDEPTSFMDSWAEAEWLARFRTLVQGRTALIITHRFITAMQADVIHVLDRGRIIESGSHADLLAQDGRYAQSWRAQTQGEHYDGSSNGQPQPVHAQVYG